MRLPRCAFVVLLLSAAGLLNSTAHAGPITTNRLLWFKADAITGLLDNDPVSSWIDSHGGNNATATLTQRPTYQSDGGSLLNGLPVVRFDGSDDRLTTPSVSPGSDEATVLVVAKVTAKTSFGEFVTYGVNGAGSWNLRQESSTGRLSFINGGTNSGAGATGAFAPAGTTVDLEGQGFKVLEGRVTAANSWQIWENGGLKDTNTVAFTQAASNTVVLGNRGDGVTSLNGDIAEILVYSRALTSAERVIEENYLGSKWDRTLSVDRYAGDTPGNSNYDFGVFGIGQHTDASIVTTGTSDGLTISESGGTLGSDEWVLAGNKTAVNSINPDGTWARVWYVDKTETTGIDANLTFDYSDGGLGAPSLGTGPWSFINLLYSPTDPFNFSSLGITATVSGDQVSFFVPNAQLLDGYYTLQAITVPEPSTFALLGLGIVGLAVKARRRRNTP